MSCKLRFQPTLLYSNMKLNSTVLSFAVVAALSIFTSCSNKTEDKPEVEVSRNAQILNSPVKSQKAYDRGLAVGQKIAGMEHASREREFAVIEAHRMVAALERNGFVQSAQDFAKGVHAGMKGR